MNCEEVQQSLVFYLDEEVSVEERTLIEQHLADCHTCQRELASLTLTRQSTSQALQSLAAGFQPSPQAWDQLNNRLAKEARPSPSPSIGWLSRRAPARSSHTHTHTLVGDRTMRKRFMLPALAAALALALVAIFLVRGATPVSAQQVLDRAYQAQQAQNGAQGIQHIRIETYNNYRALENPQAGVKIIDESYLDFQSGNVRNVTTDASSGRVLEVFAYDGSYTYSSRGPINPTRSTPLTIWRVPQIRDRVELNKLGGPIPDSHLIFEKMRHDPNAKLVGKETLPDGRNVYILQSEQPAKVMVDNTTQLPTGYTTIVFDAQTYQIIESKTTIHKDGQEILTNSDRYLANEILSTGSPVAWDLNDLKGVEMVDDPNGGHGDMLPARMTQAELVEKVSSVYALNFTPEGYDQVITTPPQQKPGEPFIYNMTYRNQAGDYFTIQTGGGPEKMADNVVETYKTASGLVLNFIEVPRDERTFSAAIVQTPDGSTFIITSSLPLDQVKQWAEDLIHTVG